jgi:hypothetical protein
MSVASAENLTPAVLGGGSQTLAQVLTTGNSAGSSDIDMNNNDITGANAITCDTLNYTTLNPPVGGGGGGVPLLLNSSQPFIAFTGSGLTTIFTCPTIQNVAEGVIQVNIAYSYQGGDTTDYGTGSYLQVGLDVNSGGVNNYNFFNEIIADEGTSNYSATIQYYNTIANADVDITIEQYLDGVFNNGGITLFSIIVTQLT